MKLVFFSDVHGNIYPFKKMLDEIETENIDFLVFGGDIFGYYYHQDDVLGLLRKKKIKCLLGNHDKIFLDIMDGNIDEKAMIEKYGLSYSGIKNKISTDNIEFLRSLKTKIDLQIDGLHIVFVHGSLEDNLNGRVYPDTVINEYKVYNNIDFVFMGHTHHKMIKKLENGTVLLNPGSIGQQRDGRGCSYMMFDTKKRAVLIREVKYDKNRLIAEIKKHHEEKNMEEKLIEVINRKDDK